MIVSVFLASLQMSRGPAGKGRRSEIKMKRGEETEWERNEGRGSLVKDSQQGRKSERDHFRFTEGMKYGGVLPRVITDESGYKTAHSPKWLICPAAWKHKSWLSYYRGSCWWWLEGILGKRMLPLVFYISTVMRGTVCASASGDLIGPMDRRRLSLLNTWRKLTRAWLHGWYHSHILDSDWT